MLLFRHEIWCDCLTRVAAGGLDWNGVELASGKVAELVKSFEHVNEILDGFRYKMGAYPLDSTPCGEGGQGRGAILGFAFQVVNRYSR